MLLLRFHPQVTPHDFNFFPTTGLLNASGNIDSSVNAITDPLLSDTDKEYHKHWSKPMKSLL